MPAVIVASTPAFGLPGCKAGVLRDTVRAMNRWVGVVVGVAVVTLGATHAVAVAVHQAILLAKPAVALVTARVDAEITMNCGKGPVTVKPSPFIETGTGWFVDGRGWVITNAHVVDPV